MLVWLPNSADCLRVWFGLNYLGAVFVPINTAYRGTLLEHAIALSEARLMIAHADLCPRLHDVDRKSRARDRRCLAARPVRSTASQIIRRAPLRVPTTRPPTLERPIAPWDMQSIIFTSGTTGPSKGRDVVLRPSACDGGFSAVSVRRRSLHDQSADVSLRRRDAGDGDADPRRIDRDGRFLQHGIFLADRAQAPASRRRSCSASWAAFCSSVRPPPTTRIIR